MSSSTNHYKKQASRVSAPWSSAEEEALTAMYVKGTPVDTIAEVLHRTAGGVYARASHLGLVRHWARSNPKQGELDLDDTPRAITKPTLNSESKANKYTMYDAISLNAAMFMIGFVTCYILINVL